MKKIFVRKVFPYDPTLNNRYSKYEGYLKIGRQTIDPGIINSRIIDSSNVIDRVYCSPRKRAIESASLTGKEIIVLKELNEIVFDLSNLVSEEEYIKLGSNLVRERFINSFVDDTLMESRSEIKKRVESLIQKIKKLSDREYLFISHSFFMKILETYLKTDDRLFEKPRLLEKYFDYKKKTYNFREGFEFNL